MHVYIHFQNNMPTKCGWAVRSGPVSQEVSFVFLSLTHYPSEPSGLSHPYQLDESTFIFRGTRSNFSFFISFFNESHESKQNSPKYDATFCGVASGAILYAYVP